MGVDSDNSLRNGEPVLRQMLELPAAVAAVPEGKRGAIIGKGGENIRRLRTAPGILAVNFDDPSSTLLVIGEATALTMVLIDVAGKVGGATGRMTIGSPADNGRLIGRQGVVVNELKTRSSCTYAQNQVSDSVEWYLAGQSTASIY